MTAGNIQPVFEKRYAAKAKSLKTLIYKALSASGEHMMSLSFDIHARS